MTKGDVAASGFEPDVADMRLVEQVAERAIPLDRAHRAALMQPSVAATIGYTAFNLGLYALAAWVGLRLDVWWAWPISWLVLATILAGTHNVVHDCAHSRYAPSPTVNRVAGPLWAAPVLMNFTLYKHFHLQHHAHTAVEGDPEDPKSLSDAIRTGRRYLWGYVLYLKQIIAPRSLTNEGWFALFGRRYPDYISFRPPSVLAQARRDQLVVLGWIALIAAATIAAPIPMVKVYLIPLVLKFPLERVFLLPEHAFTDLGADPRRNVRSTDTNAVMRVLLWNGNYHAEHHAFPTIPSYRLRGLSRLIGHHFAYRARSYVGWHIKVLGSLMAGNWPKVDQPRVDAPPR